MPKVNALCPPSTDDLAAIAAEIVASFPQAFQDLIRTIPIRVQDWPLDEHLAEVGLDDPLELTGLYAGVPLGHEHAAAPSAVPDMIYLFRQPILFEWCQRGVEIEAVVFDVLAHEIGHHFGMDEAGARRLEED